MLQPDDDARLPEVWVATRLRSLYPEPFSLLLAPALLPGEAAQAEGRLRDALAL